MSRNLSRRDMLGLLGGVALLPACSEETTGACIPGERRSSAPGSDAWRTQQPTPDAAEALLPWLFEATADKLVPGIVQRLNDGLGYRDVVAAMLAATVTPDPLEMHKRAQIFAAHQLGRELAPRDDVPLMYALLRLKARLGAWSDPPLNKLPNAPSVEAAPDALRSSLLAWDLGGANVAAAVLCRAGKASSCRDSLWEAGARNHNWIGHTTIDVSQTLRTLQFGGWFRAEAAMRALNASICGAKTKEIDDFPHASELADKLKGLTPVATIEDEAALDLVRSWRDASPKDAQEGAFAALSAGASTGTVWQACRLAAAELTLRYPYEGWIKYAMHAVTTNNALRHAFDETNDARLRAILLLQSVAFLPRIRLRCVGHGGEPTNDHWHIDRLATTAAGTEDLDDVIASHSDGRPAQIAKALGWLQSCGDRTAFMGRFRDEAMPKMLEEHQIKHPAAAFEEAELAGNWADVLTACTVHYGMEPYHAAWPAYDATRVALKNLIV